MGFCGFCGWKSLVSTVSTPFFFDRFFFNGVNSGKNTLLAVSYAFEVKSCHLKFWI